MEVCILDIIIGTHIRHIHHRKRNSPKFTATLHSIESPFDNTHTHTHTHALSRPTMLLKTLAAPTPYHQSKQNTTQYRVTYSI